MKYCTFLILLILSFYSNAQERIVNIAVAEIPPYSGRNLNSKGMMIEIVSRALEMSQIKYRYKYLPFTRLIKSMKSGDVDIAPAIWHRNERESFLMYINRPVFNVPQILFHKTELVGKIKKSKDLSGNSVAATRGYVLPPVLDSVKGIKIYRTNNDEKSLMMVAAGRVKYAIVEKLLGQYLVKKNPALSGIKYTDYALSTEGEYIAVSKRTKNSHDLVKTLSKNIEILRKSGSLQKIIERHKNFNYRYSLAYKD
jgi:polar amino acid transport system substrate-binding protein